MRFSELHLSELIQAVEEAPIRDFWYGTDLLEKCKQIRHPRLLDALVRRHQRLGNKSAGSCHALRQAIKAIDTPFLAGCWHIFDSCADAELADHPLDAAWGAINIIAEIGGLGALLEFSSRLAAPAGKTYHVLVAGIAHLALRYTEIIENAPLTLLVTDMASGNVAEQPIDAIAVGTPPAPIISVIESPGRTSLQSRRSEGGLHEAAVVRALQNRAEANEYFYLPAVWQIHEAVNRLNGLSTAAWDLALRGRNAVPAADWESLRKVQEFERKQATMNSRPQIVQLSEQLPRRSRFDNRFDVETALTQLLDDDAKRRFLRNKAALSARFGAPPKLVLDERTDGYRWVVYEVHRGFLYPYEGWLQVPFDHPLNGVRWWKSFRWDEAAEYTFIRGEGTEGDWWFEIPLAAVHEDLNWVRECMAIAVTNAKGAHDAEKP
jgi:hypothetical protein